MTEKSRRKPISFVTQSFNQLCLNVEIKKSSQGAVLVLAPIMEISELSTEKISLISHSGRVVISGEYLAVSVMQDRVAEIYGRIMEVKFSYGKA